MKIKAYLENGHFVIISVMATDDIQEISNKFNKWEYISWTKKYKNSQMNKKR